MVRFQRPKRNQQRWTLLAACSGLIGVSFLLIALFQMDSFPKRHKILHKPSLQAMTPDKLASYDPPKPNLRISTPTDPPNTTKKLYEIRLAGLQPSESKPSTTASIILETNADWAPLGAQHFDELVQAQFYDQARFFRCVENFMVQFGIAADPAVQTKWKREILRDDPVVASNTRGMVTYAMSGKNTRTTQLFINTRINGNERLDKEGFAPFGKIVQGMSEVDRINHEYGEKPSQGKIVNQGNAYLQEDFPELSWIESIRPYHGTVDASGGDDDGSTEWNG